MKRMVIFILPLFFILSACNSKNESNNSTSKTTSEYIPSNLLNPEYALYIIKNSKDNSANIQKYETLKNDGYALYKQKKDGLAIEKYEEALKYFATGEIYYHYANSLSNVNKPWASERAYLIADKLGFTDKDKLYYNLACVYSIQNNTYKSLEYIEKALNNGGFWVLSRIEKDDDLENLRTAYNWKGSQSLLKKAIDHYNIYKNTGFKNVKIKITEFDAYEYFYFFCSNCRFRTKVIHPFR